MTQLPLPIDPAIFNEKVVAPALALLPLKMDSTEARCMLIAICLQESRLASRWQMLANGGKGPARGLAQFERGTQQSRGGVWGLILHPASSALLLDVCKGMDVPFDAGSIHAAIETNDVLAVVLARLLLFTDPRPLPRLNQVNAAWEYYLNTWHPGVPRPAKWAGNHAKAVTVVDRRGTEVRRQADASGAVVA